LRELRHYLLRNAEFVEFATRKRTAIQSRWTRAADFPPIY